MKNETWDFLKFHLVLGLKYGLRLFVVPYVGAVRGIWAEWEKMEAEMDAYEVRQLRTREPSGTPDAGSPRTHA